MKRITWAEPSDPVKTAEAIESFCRARGIKCDKIAFSKKNGKIGVTVNLNLEGLPDVEAVLQTLASLNLDPDRDGRLAYSKAREGR